MENYTFKGGVTRLWWLPILTGILSVVIGVWCLCDPGDSLPVLAYFFTGCIIGCGVLNVCFGLSNTKQYGWGWPFAIGLLEVFCGIWLCTLPAAVVTAVFIYTIGIYLIVVAINSIAEACMLSSAGSSGTAWLIALLLITLVFAILFLAGPIAGGIAVWLYIGISFVCYGIYRIIYGATIRRINRAIRF